MSASFLGFRAAVLFGLSGMGWGILMAASRDHSAMPAHAHLNLLGWVSLFLFGVYYRLHPQFDRSRLDLTQVSAWSIGTVVLTIGVAAIHAGYEGADPIAAIGSVIVIGSMLLFAGMVFRAGIAERTRSPALIPAE